MLRQRWEEPAGQPVNHALQSKVAPLAIFLRPANLRTPSSRADWSHTGYASLGLAPPKIGGSV
jgi:hypothetical protein